MVVYTILIIVIGVLLPVSAYAWGPGTHLEVATSVIKDLSLFSPVVVPLIKRFTDEFIYGAVSADVLVGKKYAGYLHHCHNWRVGWQVLKGCKNDRQRASAYGYLTHLAADIIAHNYYIPYMMIKSHAAKMRNHTYWELRFDVHVTQEVWKEVKRIIRGDFDEFDRLLESTLKRPIFSFKMNKKIFSSILLLQKFGQLRRAVEIHSQLSQWPLHTAEVRYYKALINEMVRDFLLHLKGAGCMDGDPAGLPRLNYAKQLRRSLKNMVRKGIIQQSDAERFVERIKKELSRSVLDPGVALPDSYEAM